MNKSIKLETFALCLSAFFDQINLLLHLLFRILGLQNTFTTELLILLNLTFAVLVIQKYRHNAINSLLFPLIIAVLYFVTYFRLGSNFGYVQSNVTEKLFLNSIPAYIVVYLIPECIDIKKVLKTVSIAFLVFVGVEVILKNIGSPLSISMDYQAISYATLIPIIFFVCEEKKGVLEYLAIAIGFTILVFFGGRGPIICGLVCVLYSMLNDVRKKKWKILLIVLLIIAGYFTYDYIISWVVSTSNRYTFAGSILFYNNRGDLFSDSGRYDIYNIGLNVARDSALIGRGLGADRYFLGLYGFRFSNYPHNFFIEIWIQFGFIIGTMIIIILLKRILQMFLSKSSFGGEFRLFEICFFSLLTLLD